MATPAILMQRGVNNESQDLEMTTVKLTPSATSNFQTRFQIPKNGNVLDSNSSLVWTVSWAGYSSGRTTDVVLLKNSSGGLNSIQRARMYIGGKEVFPCEDVGHLIHIKNLNRNPDYQEEIIDMEIGSVHGYFDTTEGKMQLGKDTEGSGLATGVVIGNNDKAIKTAYNRYARPLGSYSVNPEFNRGIECSVMLSDIFSALQSIQLPMSLEDVRLEIDWNTNFDEVAYIAQEDTGNPITNKTINIENPVLLLDFLNFPEDARAGLSQVLQDGVTLPFIHTSMSTSVIAANNNANSQTTDIQIALQGKLLMKIYVSHRLSDDNGTGVLQAPQIGNGRCRSQRGLNMSYNLYINDLSIHDLPVDTDSMQYSFFSIAQQAQSSVIPGQIAYKNLADAVAVTDVNAAEFTVSGVVIPTPVAGLSSLSDLQVRGLTAGTQSYIGFDLSKYQQGSGARNGVVIPSDAGYRSGSSAVILRITQTGGAAGTQAALPKTVQVFTEEVRVLHIMGGVADVMEA